MVHPFTLQVTVASGMVMIGAAWAPPARSGKAARPAARRDNPIGARKVLVTVDFLVILHSVEVSSIALIQAPRSRAGIGLTGNESQLRHLRDGADLPSHAFLTPDVNAVHGAFHAFTSGQAPSESGRQASSAGVVATSL